jgi:hypothetical protein
LHAAFLAQVVFPSSSLYLPATQSTHAAPAADALPAAQFLQSALTLPAPDATVVPASQLLHVVAFSAEYWPTAQAVQDVWPVAAWDLPAAQLMQVCFAEAPAAW